MYELSYPRQTTTMHPSFREIVDILVRLKAFLLTMFKKLMKNTQ